MGSGNDVGSDKLAELAASIAAVRPLVSTIPKASSAIFMSSEIKFL